MTIILTLIGFLTFGQENELNTIEKGELDSIYVQVLNSRFDLLLSSGWKYIELNENGKRISKLNVSDRYKFLTNEELIDLSIKGKKTIRVLRLTHKIIGIDTVDVNFGIVNITGKRKIHFNNGLRFKKADFALECGGTNGYVPDMRFVFDRKKNNWELIDGKYKFPSE
ncbi:hypothetical protein P700755_000005 [Psychroflexus torquis ATCC 700755]|uniref:Uncharacterized protein n=1 Tax=Psychroflexus torquis (strain ATCC 700755 / CIP 106069 / ACAM 623) TaxID=313595 RepID=K4ING8_PSYTT|nr:hypothetical protein [Psychroflexus torquis]AFU67085.1 hypothetical protein P700755_000005 [Psychroflexus torquis ATCC 700755]